MRVSDIISSKIFAPLSNAFVHFLLSVSVLDFEVSAFDIIGYIYIYIQISISINLQWLCFDLN
jgi:hypothetical protein